MKKLLSLILATAMVISMIPAVFASGSELATVTYDFTKLSGKTFERVSSTGEYTKAFTDFTEASKTTENWAYLGSNIDVAAAKNANAGVTAGGNAVGTAGYGITAIASGGYINTHTLTKDKWIAFQIKLPETAIYKISAITANNANMNDIEFYIVPKTTFDSKVNYGTPSFSEGNFTKVGATSFDNLGISSNLMASAACTKDSSAGATAPTIVLSDLNEQELYAEMDYVLVVRNGYNSAKYIRATSITLTEVEAAEPEPEPEPVPTSTKYVFNSGKVSTKLDNSNNMDTTLYDDFSEITPGTGESDWYISARGSKYYTTANGTKTTTMTLGSYLTFNPFKAYYGTDVSDDTDDSNMSMATRGVIAVDVPAAGNYDISMKINEMSNGTEADIYVLSEADLTTYASYLSSTGEITEKLLKKLPIAGRISSVGTTTGVTKSAGTAAFAKGTNYIVLRFSSDNTTWGGSSKQYFRLLQINLDPSKGTATGKTPVEAPASVSFAASADILINDVEYKANNIASFTPGEEITVEVQDDKNFAGWIRGREGAGVHISSDSKYTFTITSNTYLTPVWTEAPAENAQKVEFWNENGAYIESANVEGGKATAPSALLTGHVFDSWRTMLNGVDTELAFSDNKVDVSELSDVIIRAVARHDSKFAMVELGEGVPNYDAVYVNGTASGSKYFGNMIPCYDAEATHWIRDGVVVAYGPSYDHYVWDGANIYSSHVMIENKPLVVLEDTCVDDAYMVEYDKGNADRVIEAGILFGSAENIVINSTDGAKAASQKNEDHGQFCAKPNGDETYARGYLMYEKNGVKYVIYTDAMATSAE